MDSLNVNVMSSAGGTNEYSFQEEDEEIKTAAKQRKAEEETKAEFNIRFTMSGPSQPYIPEVKKKEPEYPKNSKLVPQVSITPPPEQKSTKELLLMNPGFGGMNHSDRYDRKGENISHRDGQAEKDRKVKLQHKITFADQFKQPDSDEKQKLANYLYVESYKQHNVMTNERTNQGCCVLF